MHTTLRRQPPAPIPADTLATLLPEAHLQVQLLGDASERFLEVHSTLDPAQRLLLPLTDGPPVAGRSGCTRLGRLYAVCWALAYGLGPMPAGAHVRFETRGLRHRQCVEVPAHALGEQCWVAAAEAVASVGVLVAGDEELARIELADHP